jgi:hypothetical protein
LREAATSQQLTKSAIKCAYDIRMQNLKQNLESSAKRVKDQEARVTEETDSIRQRYELRVTELQSTNLIYK